MEVDRNASVRVDPYELPVLRTSSMAAFRECPRRWADEHLIPEDGEVVELDEDENEFTQRGRAVHAACDAVLKGALDPTDVAAWEAEEARLKKARVPPAERQNAQDYCIGLFERLHNPRWRLIAVEARFVRPIVTGAPPAKGTPDAIWWDEEEYCYVIQDHKTNRRWEGEEVWRRKLAPRAYAWALRQMTARPSCDWANDPEPIVDFEIGYVNVSGSVRWRTSWQDDRELVQEFQDLWDELKVYRRTKEWPARLNTWCSSCGLLRSCSVAQEALASVTAMTENGSEVEPVQRLQWLKMVIKMAEAQEAFATAEVRARVGCDGGVYREGDWLAMMRPRSKREAAFWTVWDAIRTPGVELEEEEVEALFTVKLGELDKSMKTRPALGDALNERGAITSTEQEPMLVVRLVKPGE